MKPRILLVEDDAVSRAFLAAAAEGLPATIDAVDSCAAARAVQAHGDLWLIDANLPDGNGADLLAELRRTSPETPALAHTASRDPEDHRALLAAGFAEVLVKPLPVIAVQTAICRALGYDLAFADGQPRLCAKLPGWDDAAALAALKGEHDHVVALRRLFLDELAGQSRAVEDALARGDGPAAGRVLHMLRASCGFVGAARLGEAARVLEGDLRSEFSLGRFRDAIDELLAASGAAATAAS
jgi:CheY-like chemotaxis protein/HPt (histidine-containing phosphotransfer) domain-containing protein